MFKRSAYLFLFIMILLISCDVTGNRSTQKSRIPRLRLISTSSDIFSKHNSYLSSDINFGDLLSTEKLYYLIENTGEIPVFNISLSCSKDKIQIRPNIIGTIGPEGSDISTTPIISIVCPHVVPPNNVGSLLPLEIGDISDTLYIDYQFVAPFDSAGVWKAGDTIDAVTEVYSVTANKMGVILEPRMNDLLIWETTNYTYLKLDYLLYDLYVKYDNPDSMSDFKIYNKGNASIPYQIMLDRNIYTYHTYNDNIESIKTRDTLYYEGAIAGNEFIDINSILEECYYDYSGIKDSTNRSYYYFHIYFTPTSNLIGMKDFVKTDGYFYARVYFRFLDLFILDDN